VKKRSEWRPSIDGPWPFVQTGGELGPSEREWLHTNGAGAYAMSTVALMHTRRSHGALVAALEPPLGRHVIISHAETTVNVEADKRTYRLATHQFPSVAPTPGYRLIEYFAQDPLPRWIFRLGQYTLERTLGLVRGQNIVVIAYTWHGKVPARISIRPLMPLRPVDQLVQEHGGMMQVVTLRPASVVLQPVVGLPAVHMTHEGVFMGSPDWWRRFEYLADRSDGRDFQEDIWTPGVVEMQLEPDKPLHLTIGVGPLPSRAPADLLQETREFLLAQDPGPSRSPAARVLSIAAEQFCLERCEPPLIIAGYPWHTAFTRDLVMAVTGLLLIRDKVELAKRILSTALGELRYGLLPETLVDAPGGKRAHPSPDATLWLFDVARELTTRLGPRDEFVQKRLYPALVRIFLRLCSGKRRWIWLSPDGLLTTIEPGVALTWMDAKVAGEPVTPRYGVPIELQAFFTKGADTVAMLAGFYGHDRLERMARERAQRARAAFQARFWCAETDYPYDCVSEARDAAEAWSDPSIRPNALIALAVDPDLFEEWQARSLLERVRSELLTPRGVRSLSPRGRRYVGHFAGGPEEREMAYHQGTVWPHLLGMYVRARLRTAPDDDEGDTAMADELAKLLEQAVDDGSVLGQVAQLCDGDAPHRARGCPAQATSVAELARALTALER
jgi:predicted glycogen debranching enzyme